MFSVDFHRDLEVWKKTRPEYAALVKAIRGQKPHAELMTLAFEAGATANEVIELARLRQTVSSPELRARAAQFSAAEKDAQSLDGQISKCDQKLSAAGSLGAQERIEQQIYLLVDKRTRARDVLADCMVAQNRVAAAESAGVA